MIFIHLILLSALCGRIYYAEAAPQEDEEIGSEVVEDPAPQPGLTKAWLIRPQ